MCGGGAEMKILLIEDEVLLADSIKALLESKGLQVTCLYDKKREICIQIDRLAVGNTVLDCARYTLKCGDNSVHLPAKEFEIMHLLMQAQGKALSKVQIISQVWGAQTAIDENLVEVYITMLRKKLRSIGSDVQIRVLRRLGYMIEIV